MTDHNAEIAKQLKRIADALERMAPKRDDTFTDTGKAYGEGPTLPWVIPAETVKRLGEKNLQRLNEQRVQGEGDYLLNPDADHTGEETE